VFARDRVRQRFLLVGFGTRGRQWQRELRRQRGLELAGAVDPDGGAQAEARRQGLHAWAVIDEALADASLDAAIISSPPGEHARQAIACLRSGLPVLIEKPLALSLADAAAVARASLAAGRPALVGQNFRFLPRERSVRKALAEGGIGRPLRAVIVSARPATAARPHLSAIPCGPVWDICLHHLDALRIRFGALPATVTARIHSPEASDAPGRLHVELSLHWPGGLRVAYTHSEGAPGFYHWEWIEGADRALIVEGQRVSVIFPSHRARRVPDPGRTTPEQAILQDFLATARGERASELTVAENISTVALVEAVLRSAELGRELALDEVLGAAGTSHRLEEGRS
jgi:predicted dehydrogenase